MAIQTLTGFSDGHKAAHATYVANGYRYGNLTDSTLWWLEEDDQMKRDIAQWRRGQEAADRRAMAAAAKAVTPQTQPAPVAYAARAPLPSLDTWKTPGAIAKWVKAHAFAATPLFVWHALAEGSHERHAALEQKVTALEQKLAALEREPRGLRYCGTWQRASEYERHECATHGGSVWACVTDRTRGVAPGTDPAHWQLAVKGVQ